MYGQEPTGLRRRAGKPDVDESEPDVAANKPPQPQLPLWTRADVVLTLGLLIAALGLRLYRIDHPAEVVFDEVHFGKFASYYLRGEVSAHAQHR